MCVEISRERDLYNKNVKQLRDCAYSLIPAAKFEHHCDVSVDVLLIGQGSHVTIHGDHESHDL